VNDIRLYSGSSLEDIAKAVDAVDAVGLDVTPIRKASITFDRPSKLGRSHASESCPHLPQPPNQLQQRMIVKVGTILSKVSSYCSTCTANAVMREVGRALHELVTIAHTIDSARTLEAEHTVGNLASALQNLAHQMTWLSLKESDSSAAREFSSERVASAYKTLAPDLERRSAYLALQSSYLSAPAPAVDLAALAASPTKLLDVAFKAFCAAGLEGKDPVEAAVRRAELTCRFGVSKDVVQECLEPVLALWVRMHEGLLPRTSSPRTVMFRESWAGLPFHETPRAVMAAGAHCTERALFHVSSSEAALLVIEDQYINVLGVVPADMADVVCSLARTLHIEGLALDDMFSSPKTAFEAAVLASSSAPSATRVAVGAAQLVEGLV
jgi:hypothetical protein